MFWLAPFLALHRMEPMVSLKRLLFVDLIVWEVISFWDILTVRELYLLLFVEMILRQCSLRLA